jgi:M6 family metalloprotease-like protein
VQVEDDRAGIPARRILPFAGTIPKELTGGERVKSPVVVLTIIVVLLLLAAGCSQSPRTGPAPVPTMSTAEPSLLVSIPSSGPSMAPSPAVPCTEKRALVILVEFPDIRHTVSGNFIREKYFGQLNPYIRQMSYGTVCLGGDVTKTWYEMPHPVSYYTISSRNLEVNRTRLTALMTDAVNAADNDYNFADYDFIVLMLAAKTSEYGMVGLCGYPGMLGFADESVMKTRSGQVINGGIALFTYQAPAGTLFHDTAHVLGGVNDGKRAVPCLYDHDLQAKPGPLKEVFLTSMINLGYWDPMSCHSFTVSGNTTPSGITSWTKLRLGWISPEKVRTVDPGTPAEIVLGPLEDPASDPLVIRIPLTDSTYYLIENRQPIGYDINLPGSGILILAADDTIDECRNGASPVRLVNADPAVPSLNGAAFSPGGKDVFTDQKNRIQLRITGTSGNRYNIRISPL